MHARRIGIEEAVDVALGFAGNSNDRIRHFQRGFLYPKRKVIAASELFALPRPKRHKRMDRNDKQNAIMLFSQDSAKMSVPRVTTHQGGIYVCGVESEGSPHRPDSGPEWFRA